MKEKIEGICEVCGKNNGKMLLGTESGYTHFYKFKTGQPHLIRLNDKSRMNFV